MSLENDITGIKEGIDNIFEGKADAKRNYVETGKMSIQQFNNLARKDPTRNSRRSPYKYIEWMCKMYTEGHRSSRLYDEVAVYEDLKQKNKIPEENRDHTRFKTPEELSDAVRDAQSRMAKETENKIRVDSDVFNKIDTTPREHYPTGDLIAETPQAVLVAPHNQDTSCLYGRNLKYKEDDPNNSARAYWCTATPGSSYWNTYYMTGGDTLYYILPKKSSVVPVAKEDGNLRFDRFAKVAVRVSKKPEQKVKEVRDQYNRMVSPADFKMLCKVWGLQVPKNLDYA